MTVRVLALPGSLRSASYNRKLASLGAARARAHGAEAEVLDLREFAVPVYDGDLEQRDGLPAGVLALRERIAGAQALFISSPEYNGSIPGAFKNVIDWVSRPPQQPLRGKVAVIAAASPSAFGGARMLGDLRRVLAQLGVLVLPGQLALARAGDAFDEAGQLRDETLAKELDGLARHLVEVAGKLAG